MVTAVSMTLSGSSARIMPLGLPGDGTEWGIRSFHFWTGLSLRPKTETKRLSGS